MSVLDRGFFDGREERPIKDVRFDHIEAIIAKRRARFKNKLTGRWEGGVEAARKLRKELVRLFAFADKIGMIEASPMEHVGHVKLAAGERSRGFHSWSEAEIVAFRERHPIGTKARLALEMILWTDQRGVDTMHLGRQHIKKGRFEITQTKTGKVLILPIAPQLLDAIIAMPPNGDNTCFLVNEWGVPFTRKGFGNKFRDWCDQAGLHHCTAHGLRKATLRRMAELEMPNKTMKSMSGHSKDEEINRYTEAANQQRLARAAVERLSDWELSPPEEREDVLASAAIEALERWESEGPMSNLKERLDTKSA
jgi:integrase